MVRATILFILLVLGTNFACSSAIEKSFLSQVYHECIDLNDKVSLNNTKTTLENVYHSIFMKQIGSSLETRFEFEILEANRSLGVLRKDYLQSIERGGGFVKSSYGPFLGYITDVKFRLNTFFEEENIFCTLHNAQIFVDPTGFESMTYHTKTTCKVSEHLYSVKSDTEQYNEYFGIENNVAKIETKTGVLSTMSYNIWNLEGPYTKRISMIVEQIVQVHPDVIGLQEVRFSNFEFPEKNVDNNCLNCGSTFTDLVKKLHSYGYHHFIWSPAMIEIKQERNPKTRFTSEGLAIISKYPITETHLLQLSRNPTDGEDGHQRIMLGATIAHEDSKLHFFVTHASLSSRARERNFVEMNDYLHYYLNRFPVVLVGDFNDELPKSNSINFLLGKHKIAQTTGKFKDAALTHGNLAEHNPEKFWTYTTLHKKPQKRIDFIFFNQIENFECIDFFTLNNNEIVEKYYLSYLKSNSTLSMDNATQPSDHRAIVAKFKVNSTRVQLLSNPSVN